jgi:hypothetical protein
MLHRLRSFALSLTPCRDTPATEVQALQRFVVAAIARKLLYLADLKRSSACGKERPLLGKPEQVHNTCVSRVRHKPETRTHSLKERETHEP